MQLKSFDIHAKVREDVRLTTSTGGVVSMISCALILLLSSSELYTYMTTPPKEILTIDTERSQRLPIYFNLTFPHISCSVLSVDTSDVSGEEHHNIVESIYKIPIDKRGSVIGAPEVISNLNGVATPPPHPDEIPEDAVDAAHRNTDGSGGRKAPKHAADIHAEDYCGECYGAGDEGECCNTCDQVREAYRRKGWVFYGGPDIVQCAHETVKGELGDATLTGCNVAGQIQVAQVKGKLQFTTAKMNMHVHKMIHKEHGEIVNTSHTVNYLRFGSQLKNYQQATPLDRYEAVIDQPETSATFRYHVSIVPTSYVKAHGSQINTNQYSVTKDAIFMSDGDFHEVPGVFVEYDISPIRVNVIENPRSLVTFLTNLAAILGGIFTISGIIDSFLFHSSKKFS